MRGKVWAGVAAVAAVALLPSAVASAIDWTYGAPTTRVVTAEGLLVSEVLWDHLFCSGADGASATIDWGDGTGVDSTSPWVTYDSAKGTCAVAGSHVYAEEGNYSISVEYSDGAGKRQSMTTVGEVVDAPLPAPLVPWRIATVGQPLTGEMASFSDPGGDLADHTAAIDWGDGQVDSGAVVDKTVTGSHTYTTPGTYQLMVRVQDDGGARSTGVGTVTVTAPATDNLIASARIDAKGVIRLLLARDATLDGTVAALPGSRYVGTVRFGPRRAGSVALHWHRLVHGRRLPAGRYVIELRARTGSTTATSQVLKFTVR